MSYTGDVLFRRKTMKFITTYNELCVFLPNMAKETLHMYRFH